MSALGQKQTCAVQSAMSALPPIATSFTFFGMSALGQKRTSLDHLVCASEQRSWNVDAERLSRLQVDDELELGR